MQVIDVRDLTVWMMNLVESRTSGYFNADSPPGAFTMGELITARQRATPGAATTVTWVAEDFLAAHWKPEELDLPPLVAREGRHGRRGTDFSGVNRMASERQRLAREGRSPLSPLTSP